jgi:GR25 family glycosyltransferase involved in LPS biosynthesis
LEENSIIVEDDVIFSKNFYQNIVNYINKIKSSDWDIIFLCQLGNLNDVNHNLSLASLYQKCINGNGSVAQRFLLDARKYYSSGTQGYVVNYQSLSKIKKLLGSCISSGVKNPIDIEYQLMLRSGRLKGACVFPYLIKPSVGHDTTIQINGKFSSEASKLYNLLGCLFSENRNESDFMSLKKSKNTDFCNEFSLIQSMLTAYIDIYEKNYKLKF